MRTIQLPAEFLKIEQIDPLALIVTVGRKFAYISLLSPAYTVDMLDNDQGYLVGWNNEGAYHAFKVEEDSTATPVLPSHAQQLPRLLESEPEMTRAIFALGMILSLADYA